MTVAQLEVFKCNLTGRLTPYFIRNDGGLISVQRVGVLIAVRF